MKFKQGQIIKHLKSGGDYIVIGLPEDCRLEATNTPSYAYKSLSDGMIWFRSQDEMEDGRFIDNGAADNGYKTGSKKHVLQNMIQYAIRDQESLIEALSAGYSDPSGSAKGAIKHAEQSIQDFKKLLLEEF